MNLLYAYMSCVYCKYRAIINRPVTFLVYAVCTCIITCIYTIQLYTSRACVSGKWSPDIVYTSVYISKENCSLNSNIEDIIIYIYIIQHTT